MKNTSPWKGLADLHSDREAVRKHYRLVREDLLQKQKDSIFRAIESIKNRDGFQDLEPDGQYAVLRPLKQLEMIIDPDATAPSLVLIKQAIRDVEQGAAQANEILDEQINDKIQTGTKEGAVVKVEHRLSNRVIATIEELEQELDHLRDRCTRELQQGHTVRLI
jgi:hypothetical protein